MRQYLFHGKRVDNGEWVEGMPCSDLKGGVDAIQSDSGGFIFDIYPESFGQYTEMHEFVVTDKSFNKPLFEGDIVEVWSRRRPPTESITLYRDKPTSQYDVEVKARAVICFKYGKWFLDYDNEYNKNLCKLRGNEQIERTVNSCNDLDDFRYRGKDEDWYREHNHRYKWHDIVKIGNMFDNKDLLEG